jgi:hypothetical protein
VFVDQFKTSALNYSLFHNVSLSICFFLFEIFASSLSLLCYLECAVYFLFFQLLSCSLFYFPIGLKSQIYLSNNLGLLKMKLLQVVSCGTKFVPKILKKIQKNNKILNIAHSF